MLLVWFKTNKKSIVNFAPQNVWIAKYWCSISFCIYHLARISLGFFCLSLLMPFWRKLKLFIRLSNSFSTINQAKSKVFFSQKWLSERMQNYFGSIRISGWLLMFLLFQFIGVCVFFFTHKIKANRNSFSMTFFFIDLTLRICTLTPFISNFTVFVGLTRKKNYER